MAIVSKIDGPPALSVWGKLGPYRRWQAGEITWSQAKAEMPYAGIWIRRHLPYGVVSERCRFYKPTNPRTFVQQNWRLTFRNGVIQWHNLTPPGKQSYNERARKAGISGFNLFMREFLKGQ